MVMDSLSLVCENSKFFKYADDLTVLHFMRNTVDDNLQVEMEHIESWTADHSLSINLSKSSVMNVITKRSIVCNPVFLSSSELRTVSHVKILGCLFSFDMKWNSFVETLIKRASQRVYLILCLKRANCPPDLLFRAYSTYIRPILLYAFPAVCNMPSYLKKRMFRVERRILRIIDCQDFREVTLFSAGDLMCENLFDKVCQEPMHPLRSFF